MIYKQIVKLIERNTYDREKLMKQIDMFYLFGRITEEEYKELMQLLGVDAND